ncbi:MAG: hypothetical protein M4579_005232, partial [Chaenotheca gracillima]
EFALYRHHLSTVSGRPHQGWLRNMFYSLTQQMLRQDPVWWVANATARSDGCWRLQTHPYIVKDASAGDRTGFLHLDMRIDVPDITETANTMPLSSSVSLEPEDEENCTIVVPGFHQHLEEWVADLRRHGPLPSATGTINCQQRYGAEERRRWGPPVPEPCPEYGLRLTRPELIHDSSPTATSPRRTVFAWHMAFPDGTSQRTLVPGALDWHQLAQCHRELRVPEREPSGQPPKHRIPCPEDFRGAVLLPAPDPLGEALRGARSWDDFLVREQCDILLGDDDEAAWRLVRDMRRRLVAAFETTWDAMKAQECEAYGNHAYFAQTVRGVRQ